MKKIKIYLSFIAIFALLFTSCSKDESSNTTDSDKATLSFGAIVADLAAKSTEKQSAIGDMPACSDDTPAYVEIVLMQGDNEVVGTAADPYRVDLVAGQVFTEEDEALELVPGNYSLNHFSVYDADGDLLWLAPRGGDLAAFVDNSLPIAIELGAGVKKYVDVSVLCYDDRDVNLYGYQFFELDINEAFEFCFFANYCTPEGRHFPARYSVDISIDGTTLYEGVINNTDRNDDGDLYADALCFALPNLEAYEDNEEYIDYTLTLLDWTEEDDAYGDVEQTVITGSLSRAEIMANFDGDDDVEYEHFRFGCGDDDQEPQDTDNDGIPDSTDECPTEAGPSSNNGCPEDGGDTDSDGDGVLDGDDECPDEAGPESNNGCPVTDTDTDGDGVLDGDDDCPTEPGLASNNGCPDTTCSTSPVCELDTSGDIEADFCNVTSLAGTSDGWIKVESAAELDLVYTDNLGATFVVGKVDVSKSAGNDLNVTLDTPEGVDGINDTDRFTAYAIEVRPSLENGEMSDCREGTCESNINEFGAIQNTFSAVTYEYPVYVKVSTVSCFTPANSD